MPTYFKIQGVVENGGQTINTQGLASTDKALKVYPSATVTVYLTGTLTLATIYSDGTGTPLANPFTADSTGFWYFFVASGTYDIKFSGGGLPAPVTRSAVTIAGPADLSNVAFTNVANVFTKVQTIDVTEGNNALLVNGGNIEIDAINPTVTLTGSSNNSTVTSEVAASGKSFDRIIHGSAVGGSLGTGGPPLASLAELFAFASNIAFWQNGSDGSIWFGTNDILRAKLNSTALQLARALPLELQGGTSGSAKHKAQDFAGSYVFQWPNTDPLVGDNLSVLSFSGGIVTIGYQAGISTIGYDLAVNLIGLPSSSQVIYTFIAARAFTLSPAGSQGKATIAATAQTDFLVTVNGTTKATLRFAAGATTSTVISPVSTSIAVGDLIKIVAPASPDATLANLAFTLTGIAVGSTAYDMSAQVDGIPTSSENVLRIPMVRVATLLTSGAQGFAGSAATAQTDFLIQVNGVTKGTLRFAAAGTVASVVGAVNASLVATDIVTIVAPASPDATLADLSFTLEASTP